MKFGISTASLYPNLTEEILLEFGKRGVECAEIFINTFSEMSPTYVRELRRIADSYGISIPALHPFSCAFEPFLLFTGYERRFQDALEWHRPYFETANQLGAGIYVFHGDKWRGPDGESLTSDEEYFERFARFRDLGKQYGVTVAQENVERCRSRDLGFLKRMVDYLDGNVAFVFDNKQAFRSGLGWAEYLEDVGSHVVHMHLSDNGPEGDCLPIGAGSADFPALLAAAREKGFDGCALVELYGEHLENCNCVYDSWERLRRAAPQGETHT